MPTKPSADAFAVDTTTRIKSHIDVLNCRDDPVVGTVMGPGGWIRVKLDELAAAVGCGWGRLEPLVAAEAFIDNAPHVTFSTAVDTEVLAVVETWGFG